MVIHHSARIQAPQQQNGKEVALQTSNDVVALTLKAYYLCCLSEDVCFMICCDHCIEWDHGDCADIIPDMVQKMSDDNKKYVCSSCILDAILVTSASVGPHISSVYWSK